MLLNLLDFSVVVLGGPFWDRLSSTFLPVLRDRIDRELVAASEPARVLGSAVGEQVAAVGAAELVLTHFLAPTTSALVMD